MIPKMVKTVLDNYITMRAMKYKLWFPSLYCSDNMENSKNSNWMVEARFELA